MEGAIGTSGPGLATALVAPFLVAAIAGAIGRRRPAGFAAFGGLAVCAAAMAAIAAAALGGQRFDIALGAAGDWVFELDAFTACAATLTLALGAAVAAATTAREPARRKTSEATPGSAEPAAIAASAGLAAMAVCAHDMTIAVAAAAGASLTAFAATAAGATRDMRALQATFEGLATTMIAASLALIGAALATAASGQSFDHLRNVAEILSPRAAAGGLALTFAGLACLAALAPLHTWLAPTAARGFGAALFAPAFAALALMLRVAGAALQTGDAHVPWMVCVAIAALGAASIAIGSLQALAARDGGRLVAHLVTVQGGFVALGFGLGTPEGAAAAMLQGSCAALGVAALAAASPALGARGALDGLGARAPFSAAAVTAALLSLLGAPLTAGFAGKWRLAAAALERGWHWAAWIVAAAALAGVVFTARALERIWFRPSSEPAAQAAIATTTACLAGAACVALGFDARGFERIAAISAAAIQGALR